MQNHCPLRFENTDSDQVEINPMGTLGGDAFFPEPLSKLKKEKKKERQRGYWLQQPQAGAPAPRSPLRSPRPSLRHDLEDVDEGIEEGGESVTSGNEGQVEASPKGG